MSFAGGVVIKFPEKFPEKSWLEMSEKPSPEPRDRLGGCSMGGRVSPGLLRFIGVVCGGVGFTGVSYRGVGLVGCWGSSTSSELCKNPVMLSWPCCPQGCGTWLGPGLNAGLYPWSWGTWVEPCGLKADLYPWPWPWGTWLGFLKAGLYPGLYPWPWGNWLVGGPCGRSYQTESSIQLSMFVTII